MALCTLTWTTINVLEERFLEDWLLAKRDKTRVYKSWIFRAPFMLIIGAIPALLYSLIPAGIVYFVIHSVFHGR